jgi:hypothetical protein
MSMNKLPKDNMLPVNTMTNPKQAIENTRLYILEITGCKEISNLNLGTKPTEK